MEFFQISKGFLKTHVAGLLFGFVFICFVSATPSKAQDLLLPLHSGILNYSWLCSDYILAQGLSLDEQHARKASSPLYDHSVPVFLNIS